MSKNKKIVWGIVGVIVLVAVFFAGSAYGKAQAAAARTTAFAGRTRGAGGAGFAGGTSAAGGFTTGTILSKDATSITLSIMGGGSKIVFLDSNTKISKQATGTLSDLTTGTAVSVAGAANSDGSINATTVQIRPNVPTTAPTTTQ